MRPAVVAALQPAGLWTDEDGTVHIRLAGTGQTFCDLEVSVYTGTRPTSGCQDCVDASLLDYARRHVHGRECRA